MIQNRERIIRGAAAAADRLQEALDEGPHKKSAATSERGGGGRAPVHGSAPLDIDLVDCLADSFEVVMADVLAMREILADPDTPRAAELTTTLQAGFEYVLQHVGEVPEHLADSITMTCRVEHGRYVRTLSKVYGDAPRRCPGCGRPSLLPESALLAGGKAHVLVCSTPECDPVPGQWRRFDVVRERGALPGVDLTALVGLQEVAALTGIPYRTLDSGVRRANFAPARISATGLRLYRLGDLMTLPALRNRAAGRSPRAMA